MECKTPLYDRHVALGAKPVPFAGYLLPIQYVGIIEEHMAVRQRAGLFDVSHMGEVVISGPGALDCIHRLLTNSFDSMADGRVRYSLMCREDGGILDDLLVYRMAADRYLIVINAANRDKDVAWMREHLSRDARMEDVSDETAQIALQGPKSREILLRLADAERLPGKYYTFTQDCRVAGIRCLVSQTGYTGEHGYELYCTPGDAPALWDALLDAGRNDGLVPCGLGARDTLRLEAAMPLYGHEMDETISPQETGLGFAVKMNKPHFIGKEGILARGTPKTARIGLKITGRGIAREHNEVFLGERSIGRITSGTFCPFLNGAYAMALVEADHGASDAEMSIDVRGRRVAARTTPLPFYRKPE